MKIQQETNQYLQSVADLEEMLEDECLCESTHIDTGCPVCDILATHRVTIKCQGTSPLICDSLALSNILFMESAKHFCDWCRKLASECWTVTPL